MPTPKDKDSWWEEYAIVKEGIREWGPEDRSIGDMYSCYPMTFIARICGPTLTKEYEQHKEETWWTVWDKWEQEKNGALMWLVCQSIWNDAPDEPYIHEWKYWGRFCDLCSEGSWIFQDELEALDGKPTEET